MCQSEISFSTYASDLVAVDINFNLPELFMHACDSTNGNNVDFACLGNQFQTILSK